MIEVDVPGRGTYRLEHVVLDVNGTIAVGGQLVEGVAQRLRLLRQSAEVHLLTADTRGQQHAIDTTLDMKAARIAAQGGAAQKAAFVRELGGEAVCAIGNGAIDAEMVRAAALGIAVLGGEGLALETLNAADVVAPHINAALDLLLDPRRLVATLRD
jgi:soluble P-type ATPase